MRRIICIALIACMLFAACAGGEGVSKLIVYGDSIATGYALKGYDSGGVYACQNYGMQISRATGLKPKSTYVNLAVDGMDTQGLAEFLPKSADALAACDTAIVSIGGNDILGLGIEVIKASLGLKPDASTDELMRAINNTPNALEIITDAFYANKPAFDRKAAEFPVKYQRLMTDMRRINPNMTLYVLSLYNPLNIMGLERAAAFLNSLFTPMNNAIYSSASAFGYKVLPVGEQFSRHTSYYTNIDTFDIHPSQMGHNLIFSLAVSAMGLNDAVPAKSINIKKSSLALKAGASQTLKLTVKPKDASGVIWSSANENVARVDQSGTVTAMSKGATYIFASLKSNPGVRDRCKVTVTGEATSAVSFTTRSIAASKNSSKNGAIEIIPTGGGGAYNISVDGGRSWALNAVSGAKKIKSLSSGVYSVVVADSTNPANRAESEVYVGYKLAKPRLSVKNGMPVKLSWSGNGESYEVWRYGDQTSRFELIGVTSNNGFEDVGISHFSAYRYKVRAIGPDGSKSAFSNAVKGKY